MHVASKYYIICTRNKGSFEIHWHIQIKIQLVNQRVCFPAINTSILPDKKELDDLMHVLQPQFHDCTFWSLSLTKVFLDNVSARICELESFGNLHHHLHLASWRRMLVGRKVRNSTNNYCTTWSSEVHPCISNPRQCSCCHYWPASAHPHLTKIKITRKKFDVGNEHSEIMFLPIVASCNAPEKKRKG